MRRFLEAKKPSDVTSKMTSRKVRNTYIAGDVYDMSDSNRYDQEDTYTDTNGNGFILDKAGNEYAVRAGTTQSDTGRIACGATNYYVYIYLAKDLVIHLRGYSAIFPPPHGTCIIADLQNGYYLEDYLAKNEEFINYISKEKPEVKDLIAKGDPNAKSYTGAKADKAAEKQAKFDSRYLELNNYSTISCEIKDGTVVAKPMSIWAKDAKSYQDVDAPQNILDMATVLFEINGYTFKDFEGTTFYAKIDAAYNLDVRYDTETKQVLAFEKHGSRMQEVDFSRVAVKLSNIRIVQDSEFGKLIMKNQARLAGRKTDFVTTDAIWRKKDEILSRGAWGTNSGYNDTVFSLSSSASHMRSVHAAARRHAKDELEAEFEKLKNPSSFTYEALLKVINTLPKKELVAAAENPVKEVPDGETGTQPVTTGFTPDKVSTEKMTAWHNGERKQNVKACSDEKLKKYYKTCMALGFTDEASKLSAEAKSRGLELGESRQFFRKRIH